MEGQQAATLWNMFQRVNVSSLLSWRILMSISVVFDCKCCWPLSKIYFKLRLKVHSLTFNPVWMRSPKCSEIWTSEQQSPSAHVIKISRTATKWTSGKLSSHFPYTTRSTCYLVHTVILFPQSCDCFHVVAEKDHFWKLSFLVGPSWIIQLFLATYKKLRCWTFLECNTECFSLSTCITTIM